MSYRVRFVNSALATVLDVADGANFFFNEEGSDIPTPENKKLWLETNDRDGAELIDEHYENISITLSLTLLASSVATLDALVNSVWAQITKKNILEFRPEGSTSSYYYNVFPYDKNTRTWHRKLWRREFVGQISFTLQALPHAFGSLVTLKPLDQLIVNGNFSTYTGSGATTNWTGWALMWGGGGAATVAADLTNYVFGATGCQLKGTANDTVASVQTTDFITVDPTHHFNLLFSNRRASGADVLTATIIQYNAAGADLTDNIVITPAGAAAWRLSSTIIEPAGTGGTDFHASCAKIKILFKVAGVADWTIDGVWLSDTEYISGHQITNPLGIVYPAAALLGNVPSPVDIYLSSFDTLVKSKVATYIGGRAAYDDDYNPCLEALTGTDAYDAAATNGTLKTFVIPGELVVDGGFEIHDSVTPLTNWTNWVESRGIGGALCYSTSPRHSGAYSVYSEHTNSSIATNSQTSSAGIVINAALDHAFAVWYMNGNYTGMGRFKVEIKCYSDASCTVLVGTLTAVNVTANTYDWTQATYAIAAASWPAGTIRAKIVISHSGQCAADPWSWNDSANWDDCSLVPATTPVSFDGKNYIDYISGKVKPFLHYKLGTAQSSKLLTFQGNLESGGTDITNLAQIQSKLVNMPATWDYEGDGVFDPASLPTHRYSDNADTSAMYQELQMLFDPTLAVGTAYIDTLCLLPVDNGRADIAAEDNQHIIIDSNSDVPAVLVSADGTIDTAVWLSSGRMIYPFSLNPREGSNLAILQIWQDASGNQYGQFLSEVTLKYYPRYLV